MKKILMVLSVLMVVTTHSFASSFEIGGWTETVVIVEDIEPHKKTLSEIGSWEVAETSAISADMLVF